MYFEDVKAISGVALLLTLFSCQKDTCSGGETVILRDLTGLDGCTWVFECKDGSRLEPVNLDEFLTGPKDKEKFSISYKAAGAASVCMVGEMVEITCMKSTR